jgi:hypothetical protein
MYIETMRIDELRKILLGAGNDERNELKIAQRIVISQLFIVVAFFVALLLFGKFIGGATDFLLVLFGLPVLGFSGLIVLVYNLRRPTQSKMKYAGLCLLLLLVFFASFFKLQ